MSPTEKQSRSGPAFALAVGVIVVVGLSLRVGDLRAVEEQGVGLDPDVREYLTIARQMKHFYWPTYREPLHPALIKAATWVVGAGDRAPRLVSFAFSNVLVLVTALVGWRLFGRWPALAASAFVALKTYYLYSSTTGVRLEVYSALLLAFIWLLADNRLGRPGLRVILAGVVGGLLCLARMTSFVFVIPALAWFVTARREVAPRERLMAGSASLLFVVLMVAPYLYLCHRYLGDGLIWINRHATWWHQRELEQWGTEANVDFPSGPYVRGTITVGEFLFAKRSVSSYVGQTLRGYGHIFWLLGRIFASDAVPGLAFLLLWVGVAGYVGVARCLWRGPRLLALVFFLSLLPVSFVVPLGANPRLYLHVLPLWVLWWAWGLAWPVEVLSRRRAQAAA